MTGLFAPRRRGDDRIVRYFLLASLAGLTYGAVVGRYRLVPAAVLWIYAGAAVRWIGDALARADWKAAAPPAAGVAALLAVSATALREVEARERWRAAEFIEATRAYLQRGQPEQALAEVGDALRTAHRGPEQRTLPPEYQQLPQALVAIARSLRRDAEAAAQLEGLAIDYPDDVQVRAALAGVRGGSGRR